MNWYRKAQYLEDQPFYSGEWDVPDDILAEVMDDLQNEQSDAACKHLVDDMVSAVYQTATKIIGHEAPQSPLIYDSVRGWTRALFVHHGEQVTPVYVKHAIKGLHMYPKLDLSDAWMLGKAVAWLVFADWEKWTVDVAKSKIGVEPYKTLESMLDRGELRWKSDYFKARKALLKS